MAFKIKDGVRVGTTDVFNNSGTLLVNAPTATKLAATKNINGVAFDGSADITITSAAPNALTIGTGLSGVSYNGSAAVTIAIDSSVVTLSGTQTLTNKTLTSPTMTTPTLGVASATSINKVAITAPATGSTLTIADGKTLTVSNTLTFTGTDSSSVAFGGGGTVAYTSNKLSAFAATTSSELAGVISDETGSGALVFGTSPTISAPNITGHATIEGVTPSGATGTGNLVFSASPTFTGTLAAAALTTSGNVTIGGNLTINGTTTTVNSTTLSLTDPMIYVGENNTANSSDLGLVASFNNGTYQHSGLVRDASDGNWKLFSGVVAEPTTTIDFTTWTKDTLVLGQLDATSVKFNGSTSGTITVQATATAGSNTITLPAVTGTVVTTGDTGTVTNTMLAGSIANSKLVNSAVTVNGTSISLGSSGTITANTTNTLTIGTGLSGTSFNGSSAVTIAIDSSVVTLTGTQTLSNKSLNAYDEKTGTTTIANKAVVQATVATTTQTAVDTFAIATYRAAKYLVQVTQGSNYQVSEILVIHNGTTTTMTEYGVVETNGSLATFASDISSTNARLLVTMGSATSATINITRTTIVV